MENGFKESDLKAYLWVFYKYRWTICAFFATVVLFTGIVTLTMTPRYMASTRIIIEKDNSNIVDFKELYAIDASAQEFYQTQFKILESRTIASDVIDRQDLWKMPEFTSSAYTNASSARWEELSLNERERMINRFLANLKIQPVRNTRIVEISFVSERPETASDVSNLVVDAYLRYALRAKLEMDTGASSFLSEQIKQQRERLEESEKLLQQYKESYSIISLEEEDKITISKLAKLSGDLLNAENQRIDAESRYKIAKSAARDPRLAESLPAVVGNLFITRLKTDHVAIMEQYSELSQKYGVKHPHMIALKEKLSSLERKIADEIGLVINSLRQEYEITLDKERALRKEMETLRVQAQNVSKHAIAYGVLARDVQVNKQMYEILLTRLKEAGITSNIRTTNVRVLDKAVPPTRAFRPRKLTNMAFAVLIGFFGGLALAIFLETIDNTIKTPDDIERYIKIPHLSSIPVFHDKLKGDLAYDEMLVSFSTPDSTAAEAYRGLRTSILFSSPDENKTLLVTSSNPAEGKSTTSSNMAVAMAQNGARTLLIDVDFRRPVIHKVFKAPLETGFSNLLIGAAELDDIIIHTDIPNMDVIPCGHIPPNPTELLGSESLKVYMGLLRQRYDKIIFDSSPVMSTADPVVLSTLVDEVVLVIMAGKSSREMVLSSVKKLQHVKANLIGSALNGMADSGGYYYYGQYGYGTEKKRKKPGKLAELIRIK